MPIEPLPRPIYDALRGLDNTWLQPEFGELFDKSRGGLADVDDIVAVTLLCFLAPGKVRHVLYEGTNGSAKTMLATQINDALLGPFLCSFYDSTELLVRLKRSQGSPELSPSDLIGADSLGDDENGSQVIRFSPGPLPRQYLLFYADELNRTHPRTQSVLLEAMAEGQVTINSQDPSRSRLHKFKDFFLLASQNPGWHTGTFPLPEAQYDRFMVRAFMPFSRQIEVILALQPSPNPNPAELVTQLAQGPKGAERWVWLKAQLGEKLEELQKSIRSSRDRLDAVNSRNKALGLPAPMLAAIEANQIRVEARRTARSVRMLPALESMAKATDHKAFCHALVQELGPDGATPQEFTELVEGILIDFRREEIETLRKAVRSVNISNESIYKRIAKLVYSTWSLEAAGVTAEGLEDMASRNQRVQTLVTDIGQGCSVRGAQALRDLSRALAWARGNQEVQCKDVDLIVSWVLNHRIRPTREVRRGWAMRDLITRLAQELD